MGIYDELAKLDTKSPSPRVGEKSPMVKSRVSDTEKKSGKAKKRAIKQASTKANKFASMQTSLHSIIEEKATYTFTFRYPPDLLEKLEDILHEVKKKHKVKLTKNSVAVAAMAFLLWDYETKGEQSILHQMLVKKLA